jgi:lipoprotein-anchoring transpeptidase ErfK/SrfK
VASAAVAFASFAVFVTTAVASVGSGTPGTTIEAPSPTAGATVARVVAPVFARSRLDQPKHGQSVSPATSWAQHPTTLLVLAAGTLDGQEWIRVLLPYRPDGSTGWIPRDDVVLSHTPYWIRVSTGRRRVDVYRDGHRVRGFRAVVGKPSTPTPHGLGAIYESDRQPDPHGFVGPWVLALTLLSESLHSFDGGPGRVGIHGRDGASLLDPLGTASSHGCVRIDDGPVTWIASHVPVGTPVRVVG